MNANKTTISEFFTGKHYYKIPVYQRAYSWEEKQWLQFITDLQETRINNYFFGNVLLQKYSDDSPTEIIDGQQRITTIIIFIRAAYDILQQRKIDNDDLLDDISDTFFSYRNKSKLTAVEYDKYYFDNVIIKGDDNMHTPQTPSQKCICKAKSFFKNKLKTLQTEEIKSLLQVIQKAELLEVNFDNKKESILMFELQNNRGKKLTNMEKLKSYLSYQIYNACDENAEEKLKDITHVFEDIYGMVNSIEKIDEDDILEYFNISRFGYEYRENDDSKNYKKYLNDSSNKISFIDDYVRDLKNAFVNMHSFFMLKTTEKEDLLRLNAWEMYPFIIKAYNLFSIGEKRDEKSLNQVFKILEVMIFRDKLVNTRADLASRLNPVLKSFDSLQSLNDGIKNICSNKIYWRDDKLIEALKSIYNTKSSVIIPYILEKYENFLRQNDNSKKDYIFRIDKNLSDVAREHIAPQTENNEKLSSGYSEYDNEFMNLYLNNIGNLVLITSSHNSVLGNKSFDKKLETYINNPELLQQREIKTFIGENKIWNKEAINNRFEKIKDFVIKTWRI